MRIIAWNCRGLGNGPAVCGLLDLQKKDAPDLLFLSETKHGKKWMEWCRWRLEMPNMMVKDSIGASGGLALFWKKEVDLPVKSLSKYHIDAIRKEEDGFEWRFTGIYEESKSKEKDNTWQKLRELKGKFDLPWLCCGDFNEILFNYGKEGGPPRAEDCMEKFLQALEDCELHDLGFVGDAFTWRNHHFSASNYIKERLDRAVANGGAADRSYQPGDVMRKFEARWLEEEDCCTRVEEAWKLLGDLWTWDREVLGELERRIRNAKRELERCRRRSISQVQVDREHILRYKLERLQDQLHVYWKQRAHAAWLTKGYRNTKFFHSYASERKRRNHIKKLKDDAGGVRRVTLEMNDSLLAPFSGEEVWAALESIGDLKAPGPDGMLSIFYKRFWGLMGDKVKEEVLEVLNVIVLIPKTKQPERLKDLRPISLFLANRLKSILPDIISPSQSAFVPGRLITDNVLLAYELTHHLLNSRRGSDGMAAIKLDMSKAYDRIEWPFLNKMMQKLGFHDVFINLIMKCVTTVSYRIKVNGEYTDSFFPQRGLRQEGLSAMLQQAESEGSIEGIRVCRSVPKVNHLFFADDSLILIKSRLADAQFLEQILKRYEMASGQVINNDKQSILFSPNTSSQVRHQIKAILSIYQEATNGRYLGLPVTVGKSNKTTFEYIKHKVWARIQGWQEKLLSKAGKEILVKAVAQAIPTYAMSCFALTKGLCDELSSIIGRYWWSQQDKCKPRGGISYSWRSILEGVQLLKKGIIWRIGDGTDTYIWRDPWIPRGSTRSPITPRGSSLLSRVSDLLDPGTGRWDEQLVRDTFWPEDVEDILTIPTHEDVKDWPAWHFDPKGIFSVKSAYKLAVQIRDQEMGRDVSSSSSLSEGPANSQEDEFKWHRIWQLKFPNKINMFIWRLAHNSLPV
ncbi:hypothetical protein BS78_01G250800 [Paspalum vaginatum]|nr:hypothetical protein BS78_01G250800 [Paspalum vaginatum]